MVSSLGNACTASDQVVVYVGTNFYLQHNADTTVCTGASINAWASAPNVSATGYVWSINSLNAISCNNCATTVFTANTSDVVFITATSTFGCVAIDSFHVIVKPLPNAAFTMPSTVCQGSPVTISFIGNGSAVALYNWNFGGATYSPSTMNQGPYTASWSTAGVQTVNLSVNDNGCLANSFNTIAVLPQPIANINLVQNEVCANTPLTITTVGSIFSNPSTFNYSFGSATPSSATNTTGDSMTITFSNTGVAYTNYITLQIVSNGCTSAIDSVAVTVYPLPTADAGSDQYIFPGNTTALDGSASTGGNTYNWSPSTLVSNANSVTPTTSPAVSTTYVLLYSNLPAGCVDRDTVIINVLDCRTAQFPNSFSPNGDGKNDYFMLLNPADMEQIERFEIFNRWGQLVFATNDKNSKGWDGTFNGVQQPVNTYIYNLQATCGKGNKVVAHGDVSLFR